MDEHELRTAVAEILEVEPELLTDAAELSSFEMYDSTARLSLMVCLSDFAGKPFELSELEKLDNYGDVVALVKGSIENGKN